MKVLVLADLHLDFWLDEGIDPFAGIEHLIANLDLLILAGDVTNKPKIRWPIAFKHLTKLLPAERIKVFPGNHDFYQFRIDGEDRLAKIATDFGVSYVNDSIVHLGSTRFVCATLWTDLELPPGVGLNSAALSKWMNDYRLIRVAAGKYRRLQPIDTVKRHRRHLSFLEMALAQAHDGQTVVVTHHVPLPDLIEGKGNLAAAYASDLSGLVERTKPDRWIYGHAHQGKDARLMGCDFSNASLGYPGGQRGDPSARIASLIWSV